MFYDRWTIYFFVGLLALIDGIQAQVKKDFRIIAYYAGRAENIQDYEIEKITHFIYCFGNLSGSRFHFGSANDTLALFHLQKLKSRNPKLKVMISLGGWGGCKTCSEVFNHKGSRREFAESVLNLARHFRIDGIDLDWEYPAIKGFPDHSYMTYDRDNFTSLVRELRNVLGPDFLISFAAGGFSEYLEQSIDWKEVIRYVDFVNIMSYDLVHGFSRISGHHTPLFSTPSQQESTDHAVLWLLKEGVPANKLIIGAAFYGRFFKIEDGYSTGLYQPCRFSHAFSSQYASDSLSKASGFTQYWDSTAYAPYAIHPQRKLLASYDNEQSIQYKTEYGLKNHLGGAYVLAIGG